MRGTDSVVLYQDDLLETYTAVDNIERAVQVGTALGLRASYAVPGTDIAVGVSAYALALRFP
eukprot:2746231-Rhodomonas_salina.1